jgi:hypothetical protein
MPEITCPACRRSLHAPHGCTGLPVECTACQHQFTAPAPRGADAEPEPTDVAADAPELFRRPLPEHRGLAIGAAAVVALLLLFASLRLRPLAWLALALGAWAWAAASGDLQRMAAGQLARDGTGQTTAGRFVGLVAAAAALTVLVWSLFR